MRKMKQGILVGTVVMLLLTGCGTVDKQTDVTKDAAVSSEGETQSEEGAEDPEEIIFTYDIKDDGEMITGIGDTSMYTEEELVWEDNFDGDTLDSRNWSFEPHQAGWVNNESQRYVSEKENAEADDNNKNVLLKDGYLIIQAHKCVDDNGKVSYTSGRINTWGKRDYTYGRFEARIMVPYGNAFLPAFWMMPTNENLYGQWPKCGEIDIMEVLGNATNTTYSTIHYGDPHAESQGSKTLPEGDVDFSNSFHVFAVEWEPGELRWYVDGELIHTENDWFTKTENGSEREYPAPFNQNFYILLNLAVGGDWPGDPDAEGVFAENAAMYVDYVKVYQKSAYDTNVTRPEKEYSFKEADDTGNFVSNGEFGDAESLGDTENWIFMTAESGKATAAIRDNEIQINIEEAGSEDYSVQLVQSGMPMIQGNKYRLSFEACADEARTMKTAITGPDEGWSRYLEDTQIQLGTEWKTYTYEFEMKNESDDNGRIEFNMGNQQPSSATLHIRNVRIEVIS